MNIQKAVAAKFCVLAVLIAIAALLSAGAFAQENKTLRKTTGSTLEIRTYVEIPEATEPCTPAECEWFKQLREAGNAAQLKDDGNSIRKYVLLFAEGLEKSYRVPLPDRPPQNLIAGRRLSPSKFLSAMRNGTVELLVEIRADGSVGDINVAKGLSKELDQLAIYNARQSIFLPAVKDRVFIPAWHRMDTKFFLASPRYR